MSGHHHHNHDHSGHCHDHDHSNDITPALQSLLYSQIQFDAIWTLNGTQAPLAWFWSYFGIIAYNKYRGDSEIWLCHCSEIMGWEIEWPAGAREWRWWTATHADSVSLTPDPSIYHALTPFPFPLDCYLVFGCFLKNFTPPIPAPHLIFLQDGSLARYAC